MVVSKTRILIVEDEGIIAEGLQSSLQELGYEVCAIVPTGEEALEKIEGHQPDLVLMDIVLENEMDGIDVANQIRSGFNIPVIYLTAFSDDETLERAKKTEPFGYIIKPIEDRELRANIEITLYKHKTEKALRKAHDELELKIKERTAELITTNEQLQNEITERMLTEREIRKSAFYLDTMSDAILVGTIDTKLTKVNKATLKLWGYTEKELLRRSVLNLFPKEEHMKHKMEMEKAFKTGDVSQFETVALTKKGKRIPVE